ncbi:MAG: glycosyltransferase family 2 protein [Desulfobulbales bacterium]|nr:glycosyltransferase family 2 protein [Desulfobulbales bacterium]
MADADNPLISLVIPCYNEAEVMAVLRREITAIAQQLAKEYRFEFVFVDDGSRDNTWELIEEFARDDARVKAIALSRNFGHQIALTCGYDESEGDAVISMDADLQDPPGVIVELIRAWEKGADIVYAVRKKRTGEGSFKLLSARVFYRLFSLLSKSSAPENAGDFRLMNRKSVTALQQLRERHRYIRGMVGWLGYKTATVNYHRQSRAAGKTKYPLRKMIAFAADSIVSFSFSPLRLAYFMAFLGLIPVAGFLVYTLVQYLFFDATFVRGWTSMLLIISIFGFFNLISVGIIGEYVGRIYDESKNRPLYFIRDIIPKGTKSAR